MQQFGWIYNCKQIADFEGISVEEAWNIPTMRALNTLTYLKAKAEFDRDQLEKMRHA
jgi:hypothetical protein